jgi:hypothetical protein
MGNYKIQIITAKSEICSLIRKTLDSGRYTIFCTNGEFVDDEYLNKFELEIDCLILDKGLDEELNRKIKEKFRNTPIICLPFLGADQQDTNVTNISEPFKLSELKKAVDEICQGLQK